MTIDTIVTDLDDTLLDGSGQLSAYTIEVMAEVKRRRSDLWTADEATQELWMQQYRALRKLGKAVVARWTEAAS